MKTDALFYQVFQFDPQALFQLLQLPVEGEYTYESITIKTTEKRMDGFFKRIDGEGPNVFLEVQGLCCVASYVAFNQRPQRYPGKRYKKHHITFCYKDSKKSMSPLFCLQPDFSEFSFT